MKIELLTKPDCPSSDAARALLAELAPGRFEWSERAARPDEGPTPVVLVDGKTLSKGKLDPAALEVVLGLRPSGGAPPKARGGTPRKTKVGFLVVAGLTLALIVGSKAYQIFVEPEQLTLLYIGLEPQDRPAPPFVFKDRDGKDVRLSDFRGKTVFLNFWATWCESCRAEMASMHDLAARLDRSDFVMVAATVDDGWEPVDAYFGKEKPAFTVLHDPEAVWAQTFGTTKYPETYVIGPDGRIRAKFTGPRDWSDVAFDVYFAKVLGEPPAKRSTDGRAAASSP